MTTELDKKAFLVSYSGVAQKVIDDDSLLSWARDAGLSPRDAQIEALRRGISPLRYLRNFWALGMSEQLMLCSSTVLVCGCGGLGGSLIQQLARAGVGRLRMLDGDVFVPSNLNRQLLSDTTQLSRPKAAVAAEFVASINPLVEVEAHVVRLAEHNVLEFLQRADLVLDALDNIPSRFILAESARRQGVPFIHAAVAGWWGQLSTFLPDSQWTLKNIYGGIRSRDRSEEAVGVLGPTAAVIGSLEALEAIRVLTGRKPAYSNRLLYFDGETGNIEVITGLDAP